MSTQTATIPATLAPDSTASLATKSLVIGFIGTALTVLGGFISGANVAATTWLVGVTYWTAIALGMLFVIFFHHITDAYWSVVIRRQCEHGVVAFKWLALLFAPLIILSWFSPHDIVWSWLNLDHLIHGHPIGEDAAYWKKSPLLNIKMLTGCSILFFGIWIWVAARVRRASFNQDIDGDPRWTLQNRKTAAFGIPLVALSLTAAIILWVKSLEYHWFSTMYGVWYFASCMRGGLCILVIIAVWLYNRGDYKGILTKEQMYCLGMWMLTFTIFWAYVSFAQYFLIWNANVPEETFWYNLREYGDWWGVGMLLVFGHFLVPFCLLLSYRYKVNHKIIRRISYWILFVIMADMSYNTLPAIKDAHGHPQPFLSLNLLWTLTSIVGVGGICAWAYFRSFSKTKLIPIRDPRIAECLNHHE